jgi:dipeptide/tripeptide permease
MVNDMTNPESGHLGGLNFEDALQGLVYVFSMVCVTCCHCWGGYLSDRYLGERRSIFIGGLLIMFGHFTLATDAGQIPFLYRPYLACCRQRVF